MSDVRDFVFFDRDRTGVNLEHVTAWQPVLSKTERNHGVPGDDSPTLRATQVLLSDGHTIVLQVTVEQFAAAVRQAGAGT